MMSVDDWEKMDKKLNAIYEPINKLKENVGKVITKVEVQDEKFKNLACQQDNNEVCAPINIHYEQEHKDKNSHSIAFNVIAIIGSLAFILVAIFEIVNKLGGK